MWVCAQMALAIHSASTIFPSRRAALCDSSTASDASTLRRMMTREPSEVRLLSEVAEDAARGAISKVLIGVERLDVKLRNGERYSAMLVPWLDLRWLIEVLAKHGSAFGWLDETGGRPAGTSAGRSRLVGKAVALIAPFAYLALAYRLIMRAQSGPRDASVGKRYRRSHSDRSLHGSEDVGFDMVAGVDSAKRELQEVVQAICEPGKYAAMGAKCPRGILLTGPSGTGKTLLAMACAAEANVPFLSCSASAFVELLVGRGAARVRELFDRARKCAPCIVFIDEIDAVAKSRGLLGHSDEREQTLNQILCELDGFDSKDPHNQRAPVVLVAATNRPEVLDAALTRPGRLDRTVVVPLPDKRGRFDILNVHAKKVKLGPDVDLSTVASKCDRFSGADLANVVNEAALLAVRTDSLHVSQAHFHEAITKRFAAKHLVAC